MTSWKGLEEAGAAAMHLVRKYNPFKRSVVTGPDSLTSAASFSTMSPPSGRQSTAASASSAAAGKRSKAEKELQHLSCKIVS